MLRFTVAAVGVGFLALGINFAQAMEILPSALVHRVVQKAIADEVGKLIDQLGEVSFLVREKASGRLIAMGRAALPLLRQAIRNAKDPEVRHRAEMVLDTIRTSVGYLLEDLTDKNPDIRKAATEALGQLGPKAIHAVPSLVIALKDPNEAVREAAVGALLDIDPEVKSVAELIPGQANVAGKYKMLLRRIKVPADRQQYKDFCDYVLFQGTNWAGFTNLPPGYWVYVYPHWYIWREEVKKPSPLQQSATQSAL